MKPFTLYLGIVGLLSPVAARADYTFMNIVDNADPTFNQALAINSAGTIAGYFGSGASGHPNKGYTVTPPYSQAFFTNENFPGSVQTQVTGINTPGDTVGFWIDGGGNSFGFVDHTGTFTSVANPLTGSTPATNQLLGVNDNLIAAGFYNDAGGNSHAYTYDTGTTSFTPINPSGAVSAVATDVNNTGLVSGFMLLANKSTEGFLDNGGSFTFFEVPGSTNTQFLGVNNKGQAVGFYVDASGNTHGLIYNIGAGTFRTLDDPLGVGTTTFNGINDHSQIVGFYVDANANTVGLLASVVEPRWLILVIAAVLGIALKFLK